MHTLRMILKSAPKYSATMWVHLVRVTWLGRLECHPNLVLRWWPYTQSPNSIRVYWCTVSHIHAEKTTRRPSLNELGHCVCFFVGCIASFVPLSTLTRLRQASHTHPFYSVATVVRLPASSLFLLLSVLLRGAHKKKTTRKKKKQCNLEAYKWATQSGRQVYSKFIFNTHVTLLRATLESKS